MWATSVLFFFFQAKDGIRGHCVTGVQTCALPIWREGLRSGVRPPRCRREPALRKPEFRGFLGAGKDSLRDSMKNVWIAASALLAGACSAMAADVEVRSVVESVIVYPDGAT